MRLYVIAAIVIAYALGYVHAAFGLNLTNLLGKKVRRKIRRRFECLFHECTYYQHYLAYGGPELTHRGFHEAEKHCEHWQKRMMEYLDEGKDVPTGVEHICRTWEERIRA